jgi:hypothetical protein
MAQERLLERLGPAISNALSEGLSDDDVRSAVDQALNDNDAGNTG